MSRLDRLFAAYPLILAYVLLLILYGWQASRHATPWLFTDELQWAEQSRGVAHHLVPEMRGQRVGFSSLYAYLIAPAWWASTTAAGYSAAKYIGVAVMTASIFPGYLLARLFVPRWAALACGAATAAIPAVYFSALLIPEPFAYFWSTLCLWLLARALLAPRRGTVAVAVVALAIAPAVRSELTVLLVGALVAFAVTAATGARGREIVGAWTWRERVGAILLLLGGAIALGALGNHHSTSWEVGTHYHHRMFTYGLWALGAFTIGLGVTPVVLALAWLLGNRFREERERALGALLVGAVLAFGLYTAVKASYLSTNFAIRVEERNVVYIAPAVFTATAAWALRGRVRLVALALAGAGVGWLLWSTPYHNTEHFYSDAPGLAVLQWLNQKDYWTTSDARRLLFGILIGTVVVALAAELAMRRRALGRIALPAGVALAVVVFGWNLWGEAAAASLSNDFANAERSVLPTPPSWVDSATGNQPAMYLGQSMAGSDAFWSLEFWNRSIGEVWSTDATAPGPGFVRTPNYLDTTGALDPQLPVNWVVAGPGVEMAGPYTTVGGLRLYHVTHPIRVRDAYGNISTDANWMSTSAFYYHFAPHGPQRGIASVTLSRGAACGAGLTPSVITIRVSSLRVAAPRTHNGQAVPDRLLALRRVLVRSQPCDTKTVRFHVRTPYRIDLSANRTFQPSSSDLRQLSAQVSFGFSGDRDRQG